MFDEKTVRSVGKIIKDELKLSPEERIAKKLIDKGINEEIFHAIREDLSNKFYIDSAWIQKIANVIRDCERGFGKNRRGF